ncbi:MAG: choline transporter [Fusobacteriales bacterium]|nr:MAG: choline transporter [Fusobacteriales bacterium]
MLNKTKGIYLGVFSGVLWAVNTIVLTLIISSENLKIFSVNLFIIPLTIAFFHDFFSAIILFFNLKLKNIRIKIKRKLLFFLIFSSILGGPIGMASYLISSKFIGASYSSVISIFYPIVGILLDKIFFKALISKKQKISICIAVLGIFILTFAKDNLFQYENYILGIVFAIFCVFGWATEGVVASYSMKYGEVQSDIAIFIRQMTSAIFYLIFIIPYFSSINLNIKIVNSYIVLILIFCGIIGSYSYLFWYKAIDFLGAPLGMSLNVMYVAWIALIEILFLNANFSFKFLIAISLVIFSIFYMSSEE